MPKTRATENRRIRQEALRDQLEAQGHLQYVLENLNEIESLDFTKTGADGELDYKALQANKFRLDALKIANEQRLKLVNKYLPDERYVEISGDPSKPLTTKIERVIVDPA